MAGDEATQTFSFSTVAVLVALLEEKGVKLGMTNYQRMSDLDGNRTASSFDHQFRKVKTKAKEIQASYVNGSTPTPTPASKAKGGSKTGTAASGEKKKRVRAPARTASPAKDATEDGSDGESPEKRIKTEDAADGDSFE